MTSTEPIQVDITAADHRPGSIRRYLTKIVDLLQRIESEEVAQIDAAARKVADQVAGDKLVHVYGPGGHSNLAAQEIFFRAGGLMQVEAILDEGTLLSNGALRSMAMERLPGYGRLVISDRDLGPHSLLILVNAYGINMAVIDAALEARERGVFVIGVSSHEHAQLTDSGHPARHTSSQNLHDVVDIAIDCKVPVGDAVMVVEGALENTAAVSTYANSFVLNSIILRAVEMLAHEGVQPPMWRSGNAAGGDEANARFVDRFRGLIKGL